MFNTELQRSDMGSVYYLNKRNFEKCFLTAERG